MRGNNLFSNEILNKIQKMRKLFLKLAVWILIAELALGAILILTGEWSVSIGRVQGTFLVLALVLFLGVNSFIRLEKGDRTIQIFALIGFIGSLIFAILACLLIWEIVPLTWIEEEVRTTVYTTYTHTIFHMTIWTMTMLVALYTTAGGFWISNIISIKETVKAVKSLKVTATICVFYLWIFGTIMTLVQPDYKEAEKFIQLAGLAGVAFSTTALAAWIVSRTNGKKNDRAVGANNIQTQNSPKTDAELRAEIEEQVRREMIEREVRARLEAEQNTSVASGGPEDKKE